MTEYYHGGFPGLKKGQHILPPSVTGVPSCSDYGASAVHNPDKVYICDDKLGAAMFASGHPSNKGVVYQVKPVGELLPDPDCLVNGFSYECDKAEVLKVIKLKGKTRKMMKQVLIGDIKGPLLTSHHPHD